MINLALKVKEIQVIKLSKKIRNTKISVTYPLFIKLKKNIRSYLKKKVGI